jgi:hypothetical protein
LNAKSKAAAQIRALARRHTRAAIKVLAAIMNQSDGPATARVSAAQALLDRGWGKAAQLIAGEEGGREATYLPGGTVGTIVVAIQYFGRTYGTSD